MANQKTTEGHFILYMTPRVDFITVPSVKSFCMRYLSKIFTKGNVWLPSILYIVLQQSFVFEPRISCYETLQKKLFSDFSCKYYVITINSAPRGSYSLKVSVISSLGRKLKMFIEYSRLQTYDNKGCQHRKKDHKK